MKTKLNSFFLLSGFAFLGLVACKNDAKKETVQIEKVPGINLEYMDTKVKPSDDFFRHVNGTWLDNNEIPSDRTRWGSFGELRKKTDEDALAILKSAMATDKDLNKIEVLPGSDQEKAVFLFQSIMDTVARNAQGIKPLEETLAKIEDIKNSNDLQSFLTEMTQFKFR